MFGVNTVLLRFFFLSFVCVSPSYAPHAHRDRRGRDTKTLIQTSRCILLHRRSPSYERVDTCRGNFYFIATDSDFLDDIIMFTFFFFFFLLQYYFRFIAWFYIYIIICRPIIYAFDLIYIYLFYTLLYRYLKQE